MNDDSIYFPYLRMFCLFVYLYTYTLLYLNSLLCHILLFILPSPATARNTLLQRNLCEPIVYYFSICYYKNITNIWISFRLFRPIVFRHNDIFFLEHKVSFCIFKMGFQMGY